MLNQKSDEVTQASFGFQLSLPQYFSTLDALTFPSNRETAQKEAVGSNLLTRTQKQYFLQLAVFQCSTIQARLTTKATVLLNLETIQVPNHFFPYAL